MLTKFFFLSLCLSFSLYPTTTHQLYKTKTTSGKPKTIPCCSVICVECNHDGGAVVVLVVVAEVDVDDEDFCNVKAAAAASVGRIGVVNPAAIDAVAATAAAATAGGMLLHDRVATGCHGDGTESDR
jgi:hypothetical protein